MDAYFKRVFVIGNGGAGKSWLASALSRHASLPLHHLDDFHWETGRYGVARDMSERDAMVSAVMLGDRWIMEGIYGALANMALPRLTALIWLDLPEEDCIANVRKRGVQGGASEASFEDLLAWISAYRIRRNNWNSHDGHRQIFDNFDGYKERLESRAEVQAFLQRIGARP